MGPSSEFELPPPAPGDVAVPFRHVPVGAPRAALPAWARVLLYILAAGLGAGGVQVVVLIVVGAVMMAARPENAETGLQALIRSPFVLAPAEWAVVGVVLVVSALFWRAVDRRPWPEFGLSRSPDTRQALGLGLVLGVLPAALTIGANMAAGQLLVVGPAFPGLETAFAYVAAYLLLAAAVGIAEEVAFRGYLLPNLIDMAGRGGGIFLSAVLFTIPHLMNPQGTAPLNVLSIFLAGIELALFFLATRSLWAAILLHAAFDFTQFLLTPSSLVQPVLRFRQAPVDWFWGGTDRAGALDISVQLVVIAVVWVGLYLPSRRREG